TRCWVRCEEGGWSCCADSLSLARVLASWPEGPGPVPTCLPQIPINPTVPKGSQLSSSPSSSLVALFICAGVRVSRKQLPPPATRTYSSAAWLASLICRARYRPRPVPYLLVVYIGSKICAATLGAIPGPRSITSRMGTP